MLGEAALEPVVDVGNHWVLDSVQMKKVGTMQRVWEMFSFPFRDALCCGLISAGAGFPGPVGAPGGTPKPGRCTWGAIFAHTRPEKRHLSVFIFIPNPSRFISFQH